MCDGSKRNYDPILEEKMILKLKNGNTLKLSFQIEERNNEGYLMEDREVSDEEWERLPIALIDRCLKTLGYELIDLDLSK